MTDPQDDPVLDYQQPTADPKIRQRECRRLVLAAVLTVPAAMFIVFVLVLSNIQIHPAGGTKPFEFIPALVVSAFFAIPLIIIAVYQWKKDGSKAFAAGILLGLGIAASIEGLCYFANSR